MTVTDAHTHEHPGFLRHHFHTPRQQFEAGKLGMWLFLATEVLLFGGLFCGYAVWRGNHPDMFKYGSQFLDTTMGAVNTAVLILSSLTMAAAVTMAQRNRPRALALLLVLTLSGAFTFLVIKYFEYSHKFHEGWFPGLKFYEKPGEHSHTWVDDPLPAAAGPALAAVERGSLPLGPVAVLDGPPAEPSTVAPAAIGPAGLAVEIPADEAGADHAASGVRSPVHPLQDPKRPTNAHMFFNIYFMMTGLHGLHVLAGAVVLTWLLIGALKGRYTAAYFTPVDLGGLYWHVVDLIWIFLFPLFYLI
ncbi:MAG: cytochrome c oxidase subunit 3 [Planctomycetota bacterium]|jgi:cytochrome c oxidase subunit 3